MPNQESSSLPKETHYPSYDIMMEQENWDENTRDIVSRRIVREHEYGWLTLYEAEMLRAVCSLLVDDERAKIIQYVVCHIDETLRQSIGEAQRKAGVPEAGKLIREGLDRLDRSSIRLFQQPFVSLNADSQRHMLERLSVQHAEPVEFWRDMPQKELFLKLFRMVTDAYYSHPTVWSEIGHGGPAYPRGYVRVRLNQLDPWEAQPE